MEEPKDIGNIIAIGKENAEKYVFAIMKRLQPTNYEKYNELKIQVTEANQPTAEYVLAFFKNLWVEEISREKKEIEIRKEDGESYKLEVIEIVLKKHPKLRR